MRKAKPKKRIILPDPVFNDVKVSKFVNHLMYDGKKNTSYEIFYAALETVKNKMQNEEKSALEIWKKALDNVTPQVEVKSRRVGGATFQVPTEIRPDRKESISMKNLIIFARKSTPNAMKPETVCTVVFSPTGTSKKIAETVARSIASDAGTEAAALKTIDLTHAAAHSAALSAGAVAVIAAPVYGGHVAPTAAKRLETLRGSGTPAVVIAVYGNRAFEKAAAELVALAARQGFVPVAAAAFVGEHSYSTPETPVAAGRPDAQDLARAAEFGAAVRKKLAAGTPAPVDAAKLKDVHTPLVPMLRFIRFVVGYRRRQKKNPVVYLPACDADRCTHCGRCAAICPTQAIARGDEAHTDPARCIRCCACVKGCPVGARSFHTPFAAALARSFTRRKQPVTIL